MSDLISNLRENLVSFKFYLFKQKDLKMNSKLR